MLLFLKIGHLSFRLGVSDPTSRAQGVEVFGLGDDRGAARRIPAQRGARGRGAQVLPVAFVINAKHLLLRYFQLPL